MFPDSNVGMAVEWLELFCDGISKADVGIVNAVSPS